jgi:ABC-type phosphate/phosphonate transport system substrate-binding protein
MKISAKLFFLVSALGFAMSAQALVISITEGVTYRASDAEIEAKFEPITKALGAAIKQPVKIRVISSYNGLRDALKQGQVDVAFIHPAHIALDAIKSGAYRSAAWTMGFTEYKVLLLCKEPQQPIQNWASVTGKSFVTPDPDSITAVMTRAMLLEHGLKSTDVKLHAIQPNDVKLQTTRYQDTVPFYVENGFAVYGATAAYDVIKAWKDKGGKTCAESRPVPIKQWITSTKLDAATSSAVRETLLSLGQSDAGKRALSTSTYTGFQVPSEDIEKMLIIWLGL